LEFRVFVEAELAFVQRHTDKTNRKFDSQNVTLPESSPSSVIVFSDRHCQPSSILDSVLASKKEQLQRLTRRLELMTLNNSFFLLRGVLAC